MTGSPFKFLDSFTKEDREIFFGREKESEEIYSRVFQGNILLAYGASGTGKTSLIQCGLANKFSDSDWLPILVRRGNNMMDSLINSIRNAALTPLKNESSPSLKKYLQSLYLDHFKPVYLIFDQFEELFIFGTREEIETFAAGIAKVVKSDLQCRFIFVMRGEYLEHLTVFEDLIPSFFDNRIRIEKMTRKNAAEAILGPCRVFDIEVEEGFAQALLERLSPDKSEVELTYLQVFLDKIYRKSLLLNTGGQKPKFTLSLLEGLGHIGDVLSDFLEEQIALIPDAENALTVLKAFVSTEGTKRQIDIYEINEFTRTIGKDLSKETLENFIHQFVNLRILRDKDEQGKYELRHDSLAAKIYEKITLAEKELIGIREMIASRCKEYETRGNLLTQEDLNYIAPYENKIFLRGEAETFYNKSKQVIRSTMRLKRRVAVMSLLSILLLTSAVAFWFYQEGNVSRSNELAALSLVKLETDPTLAYLLAEEAWKKNPEGELALKALVNAYSHGPFYSTVKGDKYDISPDSKIIVTTSSDSAVSIYDMEGTLLKYLKFNVEQEIIQGEAFASGGKRFFLRDRHGNYTVMSLSGEKLHFFENPGIKKTLFDFSFQPGADGCLLNRGSDFSVYNSSWEELFRVSNKGMRSMDAKFSPDGKSIMGYADNTIRVFNMEGKEVRKFTCDDGAFITDADFSGNFIVTTSVEKNKNENIIRSLYTSEGKKCLTGNRRGYSISPDSRYLLTTADSVVSIRETAGKSVTNIAVPYRPGFVLFSADSKKIITGNEKFTDVYSVKGDYLVRGKGNFAGFSPDKSYWLTVADNNTAYVYDEKGMEAVKLSVGGEPLLYDFRLSADNCYAITAGNMGILRIWKLNLRKERYANTAVFSRDGSLTLRLSDTMAFVCDASGKELKALEENKNLPPSITVNFSGKISPDNRYALTWGRNRAFSTIASLWDISTGKKLLTSSVSSYRSAVSVKEPVFSSDSRYAGILTHEGKAKIYEISGLPADTAFIEIKGHKEKVNGIDFSPKGKFFATASADSTAIVWKILPDSFSYRKLSVLKGHRAAVNSVKFSPDGMFVITASDDSTVRIWNLLGEELSGINSEKQDNYYMEPMANRRPCFYAEFGKSIRFIHVCQYEKDSLVGKITSFMDGLLVDVHFWSWENLWMSGSEKKFFSEGFAIYDNITVSPQGDKVLYYTDPDRSHVITSSKKEIVTLHGFNPGFSPDGKYVMLANAMGIKLYPVTAAEVIRLVRGAKSFGTIREFTENEKNEFRIK